LHLIPHKFHASLIEPKLKEIKEKFKEKREEQARAIMDLYKEAGLNPFSSILLLFIHRSPV
jgi:YidC/Oxa1 family membrane protein insertase